MITTILKEITPVTVSEYYKISGTEKLNKCYFGPAIYNEGPKQVMVYYFDLKMSHEDAENLIYELNRFGEKTGDDNWYIEDIDDDYPEYLS